MKTAILSILGALLLSSFILLPTPRIGDPAPEIILKDKNDQTIKLSSLKGKLVLVDFWASWCRPCRMENPTLVKAYKQFKDHQFGNAKGFEIFSISLDKYKSAWTTAIQQDKLAWPNHGCDFKVWGSDPVATYGIKGIPANVLIDENGKIVAINLRGQQLINKLSTLSTSATN